VNFSKKITPLVLAATLVIASFAPCKAEISPKLKKHLVIAGYSILGAYSAKKVLGSMLASLRLLLLHIVAPIEGQIALLPFHLLSGASFAFFGFLTWFATKNIMQEIKSKEPDPLN